MKYLSLFSGIGGFDLGLDRAAMSPVAQVEFSPKCRSVLRRHWPATECFEDVRTFDPQQLTVRPQLVCGGFPCQDVSVAGRRAGLAGNRSGLWWEMQRIIADSAAPWFLVENVPGLLSSNDGRDFSAVIESLVEIGYGIAWRVLDAQYFGVAQRRERVFIVGYLGNVRRAAEVLFESDCLPWDSPPIREAKQAVAASLASGTATGSGVNRPGRRREDDTFVASDYTNGQYEKAETSRAITTSADRSRAAPIVTHTLTGNGFGTSEDGTGRGTPLVAQTLGSHHHRNCPDDNVVPIAWSERTRERGSVLEVEPSGVFPSLKTGTKRQQGVGVRRLTPRECERLQGFPDDWTRYDADGNELADSPRYQMIGNAVAVPVAEWIGRRIMDLVATD